MSLDSMTACVGLAAQGHVMSGRPSRAASAATLVRRPEPGEPSTSAPAPAATALRRAL